jgi:predicted nucleic acid-binding protein
MSYLLDVSALLALLWDTHPHNVRLTRWQDNAQLAVCPLTELGFVRISTQPVFGASVKDARKMLQDWKHSRKPGFIPCDLELLATDAPNAGSRTTDFYLSSLAAKHGMELATLDERVGHKSAYLIPD